MAMTPNQDRARMALAMEIAMRHVSVTAQEMDMLLDRPYAEWTDELKKKAGPLAELVRVEDEKAASGTANTSSAESAPSPER